MTEEQIKSRAEEIERSITYMTGVVDAYTLSKFLARLELRLEALEGKGGDDTWPFLHECQQVRNRFCVDIDKQKWNTELRTSAENILVMYDQLMERLKNQPKGKGGEKTFEEWPTFSEWIQSRTNDLDKAGEGYEALSEKSKNIIDYAVKNYIAWNASK